MASEMMEALIALCQEKHIDELYLLDRLEQSLAMQRGGSVADVWVVADQPVKPETLIPPSTEFRRTTSGTLPSRAADNLYWLGRYVERAEATLRVAE